MRTVLVTGASSGIGFAAVERFLEKVTQQYARMTIHHTVKEEGFQVEEEWEMDNNSIELTVSRWI